MKKQALLAGYELRIIPEEGKYFAARFPDFPGIITGGKTPEAALRNAREALALTLEVMQSKDISLPVPKRRFSGQFNVRAPHSLHRALVQRAEEEGVSLNTLVTHLLSSGLPERAGSVKRNRRRKRQQAGLLRAAPRATAARPEQRRSRSA